jgi:hypothetical protein
MTPHYTITRHNQHLIRVECTRFRVGCAIAKVESMGVDTTGHYILSYRYRYHDRYQDRYQDISSVFIYDSTLCQLPTRLVSRKANIVPQYVSELD